MPFYSYGFILAFLPLTVTGYFILCRFGLMAARKVWLIAASLIFYAAFSIRHVPVLTLSVLVNYALSRRINTSGKQAARRLLHQRERRLAQQLGHRRPYIPCAVLSPILFVRRV